MMLSGNEPHDDISCRLKECDAGITISRVNRLATVPMPIIGISKVLAASASGQLPEQVVFDHRQPPAQSDPQQIARTIHVPQEHCPMWVKASSGTMASSGDYMKSSLCCPYCDYRTDQHYNLKRHVRKHTGEKPFTCNTCHKSFSHNTTLRDHLRLHTGEKPFNCPHCYFKTAQKTNLRVHLKNIHNI